MREADLAPVELREVRIPAHPPRDAKVMRQAVDVRFMLRVVGFVKWLFLIMGGLMTLLVVVITAVALANGKNPFEGPYWAMVGVGSGNLAFGLLLAWWNRARERKRMRPLTHGVFITGRVVKHSKRPGIAMAMKHLDTQIVLEAELPNGSSRRFSFQTPLGGIREVLPVGAEVLCLYDAQTDTCLCPAQFGAALLPDSTPP